MATTNGLPSQFNVRQMTIADVPAVIELQMRAFPGLPPWRPDQLTRHLEVFPEGQLVVSDSMGHVRGSASSLLIDWDDYAESANWSSITGDGSFDTHNPLGKTLYGADMGVDPEARQQGIGTALYEARKELIREQGLKRLLTGGRIPGYAKVAGRMTAKEYVAEVVDGIAWFRHGSGMAEPGVHFVGILAGQPSARGSRTGLRRGPARDAASAPGAHRRRSVPAAAHCLL